MSSSRFFLIIVSSVSLVILFSGCWQQKEEGFLALFFDCNPQQRYYPDFTPSVSHPDMWTRFHILRSYYPVLALLNRYPGLKVTINLSGDLLRDLELYLEGIRDPYWELSLKAPEFMSKQEKLDFIRITASFLNSIMAARFAGSELLFERFFKKGETPSAIVNKMRHQDLRDLQVWVNLLWLDDLYFQRSRFLELDNLKFAYNLAVKGKNFKEEEKRELLKLHQIILKNFQNLLTKYTSKNLKRAEITITPDNNQIIPVILSLSTLAGNIGQWDRKLLLEAALTDVKGAISSAINRGDSLFNSKISGIYPFQSTHTESLVPITNLVIKRSQPFWVLADRALNTNPPIRVEVSSKSGSTPGYLPPCWLNTNQNDQIVLFPLNSNLEDILVSALAKATPKEAAVILYQETLRLLNHSGGLSRKQPPLVTLKIPLDTIIELFPQDFMEFMDAFYQLLTTTQGFKTITFSSYLSRYSPEKRLQISEPGTENRNGFAPWFGDKEEKEALKKLAITRLLLEKARKKNLSPNNLKQALTLIHLLENQIWYKWFGDDYNTGDDRLVEQGFNTVLKDIYQLLKLRQPGYLSSRIVRKSTGTMPSPLNKWLFHDRFTSQATEPLLLFQIQKFNFTLENRILSISALYDSDGAYLAVNLKNNLDGYEQLHLVMNEKEITVPYREVSRRREYFLPYSIFPGVNPLMEVRLMAGKRLYHRTRIDLLIPPEKISTPLNTFQDPVGDNYGDGSLQVHGKYKSIASAIDFTRLSIYQINGNYIFSLATAGKNRLSSGNRVYPVIDIYLDTRKGGNKMLLPGRKAQLDRSYSWNQVIVFHQGKVYLLRSNDSNLSRARELKGGIHPLTGDLIAILPEKELPMGTDVRALLVIGLLARENDRGLLEFPEPGYFTNDLKGKVNNPGQCNILDIIGGEQELELASWSDEQLARLRMITW